MEDGIELKGVGPFEERFCYGDVIVMLVEKGDDEEKSCPSSDERRHPLQSNHLGLCCGIEGTMSLMLDYGIRSCKGGRGTAKPDLRVRNV